MKKLLQIILPLLILIIIIVLALFKHNNISQDIVEIYTNTTDIPFEITTIDLDLIKSYNKPIILALGSEYCSPCQLMQPALEETYELYYDKAIIQFIDVWKNEIPSDLPITLIPSQILINSDGTPFDISDDLINSIGSFKKYYRSDNSQLEYTIHEGALTTEEMTLILNEMGVNTYE